MAHVVVTTPIPKDPRSTYAQPQMSVPPLEHPLSRIAQDYGPTNVHQFFTADAAEDFIYGPLIDPDE